MKATIKSAFNLETCARPNILSLQPYRCARDDYADDGTNILLDANENAYGPGLAPSSRAVNEGSGNASELGGLEISSLKLNRYPDPHQELLKQRICDYRNAESGLSRADGLQVSNFFVGVGSDEAIDAILRCFCRPGQDKILACPPTYGMYAVSAQVNDLKMVPVPLNVDQGFALRPAAINSTLSQDPSIKVIYICSPGNPTAHVVDRSSIEEVLGHPTWNGVVVLDEAYIDFSPPGTSLATMVLQYPNLIVMQTLSKAFGLAGIRLGVAITAPPIAILLNNLRAPYNVSSPTSAIATAAFAPENLAVMQKYRNAILVQRDRLVAELSHVPGVGRLRGGTDANFLLFELLDSPSLSDQEHGKPSNEVASAVYSALAEQCTVIVRFRGKELGCEGCLRVTVGTEEEVTMFLVEIRKVLDDIYGRRGKPSNEVIGSQHTTDELKGRGAIATLA